MSNFGKNVFINCPFDEEYKSLLKALIFTIVYLGFEPRIAFENSNAGEMRFEKIKNLISQSRFGIHDISRYKSISIDEFYRMNMPFELGLDMGMYLSASEKYMNKEILVVSEIKHDWVAAISDLSNCDPEIHENNVQKLIDIIRNWLARYIEYNADSPSYIWKKYNEFQEELKVELSAKKFTKSEIDKANVDEIIHHMRIWTKNLNK